MVKHEYIGGKVFVTQITFYIYESSDALFKDDKPPLLTTSSKKTFKYYKKTYGENKIILFKNFISKKIKIFRKYLNL